MVEMPVVDWEICNGCGLCVSICYCQALVLIDNVIAVVETEECRWRTQCEAVCPTGAINWDVWWARPSAPIIKEHIVEMGVPQLREVERQGRFRRLVPEEEVNWDTPVWKVFNKHPRWIIGKGRP